MRPGQVHDLTLNSESTGYIMQFRDEFYFTKDKGANQILRTYRPGYQNLLIINFGEEVSGHGTNAMTRWTLKSFYRTYKSIPSIKAKLILLRYYYPL